MTDRAGILGLLFVAGPYAAETHEETLWNVERAKALGTAAIERGFTAVVPHLSGAAGLFGSPRDDGSAGPQRDFAIAHSRALATAVGAAGGDLWVLRRDDRSISSGSSQEFTAWLRATVGGELRTMTWDEWHSNGVLDEATWTRLHRSTRESKRRLTRGASFGETLRAYRLGFRELSEIGAWVRVSDGGPGTIVIEAVPFGRPDLFPSRGGGEHRAWWEGGEEMRAALLATEPIALVAVQGIAFFGTWAVDDDGRVTS
jgi:hypothetical protein